MTWVILSDGVPFIKGDNLNDLQRLCEELEVGLTQQFSIEEWRK